MLRNGSIALDVAFPPDELDRARDALDAKRAGRAIRAALNQTANSARTTAAREVAKATGLKVRDAKGQMRIVRASKDRAIANVIAEGKRRPLIKTARNARQTTTGVSAKVGGARTTYARAFLATMPTGHRGIYERGGKKRLPIYELYGPSVPRTMLRPSVESAIQDHIAETLPRAMTRQIDRQQRAAAGKHRS